MDRYDIAIIGAGPAGISAAITAKVRNKNIILFGNKNVSNKVEGSHQILNYPGLPMISGDELKHRFEEHLNNLGISVTKKQVGTVYSMGEYFALQAGEAMYEAGSVILTGGVTNESSLPGEDTFLGRGVSYCATCDGQFYKGKKAAVIGYNEESVYDALYLSELCEKVTFFPDGILKSSADILSLSSRFKAAVNIDIIQEKPVSIEGSLKAEKLVTEEGSHAFDGIFVIRDAVAPDKLVPGLKTEDRHVSVTRQMATNIPGIFAAGDITGTPYQYVKAAGEGNVAALSAAAYLAKRQNQI